MSDGQPLSALRYGKPPLGIAMGCLAAAARWGTLPAGLVMVGGSVLTGLTTSGFVAVSVLCYPGALMMFFGLFAVLTGVTWRRRGRQLRGVTLSLAPAPAVQLDFRTRSRLRPLSELRAIEVHAMTEWFSDSDRDPVHRDTPPWLLLTFAKPPGRTGSRRAGRYCLLPVFLGGAAPAAEQLRAFLAGTHVTVTDVRNHDRARAGLR